MTEEGKPALTATEEQAQQRVALISVIAAIIYAANRISTMGADVNKDTETARRIVARAAEAGL